MKIYEIIHEFDEDGGFGDAVCVMESLGLFSSIQEAEKIVGTLTSEPLAYDRPYATLYFGDVYIKERELDAPFDIRNTGYSEKLAQREYNIKNGLLKEDTDDNN